MTLNVRVGTVVFLVLVLSTGTVRDMDSFRGREGKMAFFHFGKYWRKLPGDCVKNGCNCLSCIRKMIFYRWKELKKCNTHLDCGKVDNCCMHGYCVGRCY